MVTGRLKREKSSMKCFKNALKYKTVHKGCQHPVAWAAWWNGSL